MRGKQASILEWIAIPFSRGSSWPGIKPRSPALQADSLPSEPPRKSKIQQNIFPIWLLLFWVLCAMELHLILVWTAHSFIPCDSLSDLSSSLSPGLQEDATFLIHSAFTCKPSLYKCTCGGSHFAFSASPWRVKVSIAQDKLFWFFTLTLSFLLGGTEFLSDSFSLTFPLSLDPFPPLENILML